jgi:hypothetical protein
MIQRIQTVFLLLALAATLSFFFFPFGYIITKDASQIEVYTTGMQFNGEKFIQIIRFFHYSFDNNHKPCYFYFYFSVQTPNAANSFKYF